jgi:hypothetical protein
VGSAAFLASAGPKNFRRIGRIGGGVRLDVPRKSGVAGLTEPFSVIK